MKKLLLLSLPIFFLFSIAPSNVLQAQELTTFILVRHAETDDDGTKDPALSIEGEERARRLIKHLSNTGITAIYSTPYKRTISTVTNIAAQKELDIQKYDPFDAETLANILKEQLGGTILIAGHSNTTPNLVNKLIGTEQFAQLDESEYEHIFIVTLTDIGKGKLVHLTY